MSRVAAEVERTLRTEGLAPTGEAVAHADDVADERRAVLIAGAAQGELVRVRFDPRKAPARGRLLEIVTASTDRVTSPCRFSSPVGACGGCDWMHLTRDAQRAAHLAHVREAVGGEATIEFHPAPRDRGYRIRARLHVETQRHAVRVGFFGPRSHQPAEVDACLVLDERIDAARARVAPMLAGPHARAQRELGPQRRTGARGDGEALLALGRRGRPVMMLRWSRELPTEVFGRVDDAVREGLWDGVRLQCGEARRPADFGDPTPRVVGADGAPLDLTPGGFSQANAEVNAELARHVAACVPEGARAVELYGGAGNLSVLIARRAAQVQMVESSEEATTAARQNLAARGLMNVRVTCADVTHFDIPAATNVVVLDPPRTGAREACERIAKSRLRNAVYVSCDLATLRRDLGVLRTAWAVVRVDAFEMFPHTSHVETVVCLERLRGKS